jgi:hypothetical protein
MLAFVTVSIAKKYSREKCSQFSIISMRTLLCPGSSFNFSCYKSWTLDLTCYKCRCIWVYNTPYIHVVHTVKLQALKYSRVVGFIITSLWLPCQRVAQRHLLFQRFSNQWWFCNKESKIPPDGASELDRRVWILWSMAARQTGFTDTCRDKQHKLCLL